VFCANGAVSVKPGVSPQELKLPTEQALKARFNLVGLASFPLMEQMSVRTESRFQR
jgi:hypothetical protein